ncbi:MAG: hypothetical protein ACXWZP_02495 [Gaiellaceae bacterium]
MQRFAVFATLRPGTSEQAEKLVALGPPFDPLTHNLDRHLVFLAADAVVFVFEGGDPHALLAAFSDPDAQSALGAWESLVDGTPRIAREAYSWISPASAKWQEGWGE